MQSHLAALAIISGFLLSRLAERRYHSRNYGYLTVSGAEELIPQTMHRYYAMLNLTLPAACLEWLIEDQTFAPWPWQMAAMAAIGLGFALKLWAIQSLGRQWTMSCVYVPGVPKIKRGPYRFLAHPEYVGRFLEGLGICLFFDAHVSLGLYLYFSIRYLVPISRTERRQLHELAAAHESPIH